MCATRLGHTGAAPIGLAIGQDPAPIAPSAAGAARTPPWANSSRRVSSGQPAPFAPSAPSAPTRTNGPIRIPDLPAPLL